MTAAPVSVLKGAIAIVPVAGQAVIPIYGGALGGLIVNPTTAEAQGVAIAEVLWLDVTGPATLGGSLTTFPLQPGEKFTMIPGQTTDVSVNAASSGHRFSVFVVQPIPSYPPAPQAGNFPPKGPTVLTAVMPAYLYWQYNDDDAMQAFFASYNGLAQEFVTWFATVNLAVYTSPAIAGSLLDWVAAGLYGFDRPSLSSGQNRDIGPINTYGPNYFLPINTKKIVGPQNVVVTNDDLFKRIITWNFYKGDGYNFNIRWLKRRIKRFLIGENGAAPNVDETYLISVTFGPDNSVSIRISAGVTTVIGGAMPDRFGCNQFVPIGSMITKFTPSPSPFKYQSVLKEALDSGALQLPLQYTFTVAS